MKIKLYAVNQDTGEQVFEGEKWLDDLFEEGDEELYIAKRELCDVGRYWIGGGAAQLFYASKA